MLTAKQLEERRKFIGSSDAAAVCGVDPFGRTRADVWIDKVHGGESKTSEAMEWGNRFESILIDYAHDVIGSPLATNVSIVLEGRPIGCNLDAAVSGASQIVEAKYDGIGRVDKHNPDELPDHWMVQVQHAMYCAQANLAWLPVLQCKFRPQLLMLRAEFNDELANSIIEECESFWNEYVLTGKRPDDIPTLESAKRIPINTELEDAIDIDPQLIIDLRDARERKRKAEKESKLAEAALRMAMDEAKSSQGGDLLAVRSISERKGFEVKPTTVDQIRIKDIKK